MLGKQIKTEPRKYVGRTQLSNLVLFSTCTFPSWHTYEMPFHSVCNAPTNVPKMDEQVPNYSQDLGACRMVGPWGGWYLDGISVGFQRLTARRL